MAEIRLIFCGSRYWKDYDFIFLTMSRLKANLGSFVVIEGEAERIKSILK